MKAFLGGFVCLGLLAGAAQSATITTFAIEDWPYIYPSGINNNGQITGTVATGGNGGTTSGFVRDTDGSVTVFDASNDWYTESNAIDAAGNVSGDESTCHDHYTKCFNRAFVRAWDGTITHFRLGKGQYGDTVPCCVRSDGWVSGYAEETVKHKTIYNGFLRSPSQHVTRFSVPSSTGTAVSGMNSSEDVTGSYTVSNSQLLNGFIRASDGTFATFGVDGFSVVPTGINSGGATTGYIDADQEWHGFVRNTDGSIKTFDAPNATNGTFPRSIMNDGTIAGDYRTGEDSYAFIRAPDGSFTTFAPDGATDTYVSGMNQKGVIVGFYVYQAGHNSGFIRTP
jgi:hypothetical protein